MSNTSATGGYLVPASSQPLPGSLSLEDFIQTVIVGISGYTGILVRPKWQRNPPKQPAINTDWIAFAVAIVNPDANAYVGLNIDGDDELQRQEKVEVQVAFYGPNAQENIRVLQDGFQVQQNLEALRLANMGYNGTSQAIRGPDLINEQWIERYETTIVLVRQVQRVYPVLSFASANGSIHTVVDEQDLTLQFEVEEPS